jgi:transposase
MKMLETEELHEAIKASSLKSDIRKQLLELLDEMEVLKGRYALLEDEVKRMKQDEQRVSGKEFDASILQEVANAKLRVMRSVADALLEDKVNMNDLYEQLASR